MANLTKTVDKTQIMGSESFTYTFQVSYSGLTQPAKNGELTDFFPAEVLYTLPETETPLEHIIQAPAEGGTNVTFQFGQVDSGTSFTFTVACKFAPGQTNGQTFTNIAELYADGELVAQGAAPAVTATYFEGVQSIDEADPFELEEAGEIAADIIISRADQLPSEEGIGQFAWEDFNKNEMYEGDMPEINGVKVDLLEGNQKEIMATVTAYTQAAVDVVTSVALEEAGISHILNAEGEKIQKIVANSENLAEILRINNSAKEMIRSISLLESILKGKLQLMETILCSDFNS